MKRLSRVVGRVGVGSEKDADYNIKDKLVTSNSQRMSTPVNDEGNRHPGLVHDLLPLNIHEAGGDGKTMKHQNAVYSTIYAEYS